MSYDIYLNDPATGEHIEFDEPHNMAGGTHAMGGTRDAWLNITWNYGKHYYRVMGEGGIRSIYGKTGLESIPILAAAAAQLGDEIDPNYWVATEGNAKAPLFQLMTIAAMRPDGIWGGD